MDTRCYSIEPLPDGHLSSDDDPARWLRSLVDADMRLPEQHPERFADMRARYGVPDQPFAPILASAHTLVHSRFECSRSRWFIPRHH